VIALATDQIAALLGDETALGVIVERALVLSAQPEATSACRFHLLEALRERLEDLQFELRAATPSDYSEADSILAGVLERLGPDGEQTARKIREESATRRITGMELDRLWRPSPGVAAPRCGLILAVCLLAQQRETERPPVAPALTLPTMEAAFSSYFATGRSLEADASELRIVHATHRVAFVPQANAAAFQRTAGAHGLAVTASITAHRLWRYLVHEGYRRHNVRQVADPRMIDVTGGFSALARRVGATSKSDPARIRQILDWWQAAWIEIEGRGYHGLLTWSTSAVAAPGRPSQLRLVLGEPLLPGFEQLARKGTRGRHLVPIPRGLPPMVGRANEHSAQANLQLLVLMEMRRRCDELVEESAVMIEPRRWVALADEAGVRRTLVGSVIEAYVLARAPENSGGRSGRLLRPEAPQPIS
jgi:hypothetical protein